MKILQIVPELNVGGVETGTVDLAGGLISQGHEAVIISNGGRLVKVLEEMGAKHYRLPVHKKSIFTILLMIARVAEIIKVEHIDLVHARSRVPAWIAYFACRRTDTKLITTCHGYYSRHWGSYVMGWGKRVIVASRVIGRHMMDEFGVPVDKIRLIPRGVDLGKFRFRESRKRPATEAVVGIIGRITSLKGHIYFIRAMAKVARSIPKLRVLIVGESPKGKEKYREEVMVLVRRLGLGSYCEFLGERSDIPEILSQLDQLVVSTTAPEAFGRVIIEAQAIGVPVVATEVGGIVDIIENEKTGLLVPPRDPNRMADAIIRCLKDRSLSLKLVRSARARVVKDFGAKLMISRTLKLYKEVISERKILIFKLGAAGDLILAIPSIRAIRRKFPKAHISLLVEPGLYPIVQGCPYIDEIITYDRKGKDRSIRRTLRLINELRRIDFDWIVDFQNSLRTHLISYLSGAPRRFGYARKMGKLLLTDKVEEPEISLPPLKHQLQMLKLLGIKRIDESLELWHSKEDEDYIDRLLNEEWIGPDQLLIGINPGASKRWPTKRWPLEKFANLADELALKLNARAIIIGLPFEVELGKEFMALMKTKPINAIGKTSLPQLASLIKRCKVLVSSDSAPIHIAATVRTPLVALFGPTDPRRHLPPGRGHTVIRKDFKCSPCYRTRCRRHLCMESITVDEVLGAVRRQVEIK